MTTPFNRRALIGGAGLSLILGGCAHGPAGDSWRMLATAPSAHKQDDIFFVGEAVGWYGTGEGKLYQTQDGGETWRLIWERAGTFVRSLAFMDAQSGFLGNLGVGFRPSITDPIPLYRTRDGGASWAPVEMPGREALHGVCAIDILPRRVIFAGETLRTSLIHAAGRAFGPAAIARSVDGGETWSVLDLSAHAGMILDVKFLDVNDGFVCAASSNDLERSNAAILKTSDGGATWREVYRSARLLELCWKMSFPTDRIGYATVQNNDDQMSAQRIVKTDDGGESWTELALATDNAMRELGIGFLNERRGWVGTSKGAFETLDGGRSWRPAPLGASVNKIRILRHGARFTAYAIGLNVARLDGQQGRS